MITDQQFASWLKDDTALRCLLVEADVKTASGYNTTRYLSNRGYVTGPSDTPANTSYSSKIIGGIKFTQSLSLNGEVSLSFGDIELSNSDGSIDSWLDDFWVNRNIRVFVGDMTWARSDFRQVFSGVATGIDSRQRDRVNIKLSDKLQKLNTPISEVKFGGSGTNADNLVPLCFGECHNITPALVDANVREYQVHDGPIEDIIEVRDNGVPVSFTKFLTLGKFRLNQEPAGTITCSVQGYKDSSRNLAQDAPSLGTSWTRVGMTVATASDPGNYNTAWKLQETTSTAGKSVSSSFFNVVGGMTYTWSVYAKAAERQYIRLRCQADITLNAYVNLLTGEIISSTSGTTVKVVSAGNGWFRISITYTVPVGITTSNIAVWITSGAGITTSYQGITGYGIYIWKPQVELGEYSTILGIDGYQNTITALICDIVRKYGSAYGKLNTGDLDLASLTVFDLTNQQPVGVYVQDRQNVLEICNKLASSIGSRLIVDSSGLLSIVKLNLPATSTGTVVTASDIYDRTLEISEVAPVVASVKIGYCKNWTVQNNLQSGIPANHVDLYGDTWLTVTRSDSLAAENYGLFTDPSMTETYLLTAPDAIDEANRLLGIYSTQRKIMKYSGFYNLLLERVGNYQTIKHSRFGLENGKTGIITSVSLDWVTPKIDVEVLI